MGKEYFNAKTAKVLACFSCAFILFIVGGCKKKPTQTSSSLSSETSSSTSSEDISSVKSEDTSSSESSNSVEEKKTFAANVGIVNTTVTYTGEKQVINTANIPEGATIKYENDVDGGTDVGTYTIKATISMEGYNDKSASAVLTIKKATYDMKGVKFENASVTYDGTAKAIELTGTLPEGVTSTVKYYSDSTYSTEVEDVKLPGTYYAIASFAHTNANYEDIASKKATLTINKAVYSMEGVSFTGDTVKYDGTTKALSVSGTLPEGVKSVVKYYTDATHKNEVEEVINVGKYYAVASFTFEDTNHEPIADMNATLVVEKGTYDMTSVTFEDKTVTYDGSVKAVTVAGTLPTGLTSNDVEYYSDEALKNKVDNPTDAGTYFAKVSFTNANANYEDVTFKTCKLTIEKATYDMSGVTVEDATFTYDGKAKEVTVGGTLPEGVTSSVKYYKDAEHTTTATPVNAGTYYVVVSFGSENANYNAIENLTATLTIEKVTIDVSSVKVVDKSVVASGDKEVYTLESVPSTANYNYNVKYYTDEEHTNEITEVTEVGTYYVVVTFAPKDEVNYNPIDTVKTAVFTVKVNETGVKFVSKSETYNGLPHTIEVDKTNANAEFNYTYYTDSECTKKFINVTEAGEYTIYVKVTDPNLDYDEAILSAVLTIEKKEVTVTVTNKTITYGDEKPTTFDVTYDGFIGEDTEAVNKNALIFDCAYVKGNDAKDYIVSVSGALADNYSFTYVDGTLTVDRKVLTVEAVTLVYNGSEQTGYADTDLYTVANGTATNFGTYTATLTLTEAGAKNYVWETEGASKEFTFKIEKAEVEVPTAATGLVYTGEALTPVATSDKYTIGEVNSNAGTHNVVLTLVDANNYKWEGSDEATHEVEYAVAKADFDMSKVKIKSDTYDKTTKTATFENLPTGVTVSNIKYYSDDAFTTEIAKENVVNAGKYYTQVTFTHENANYNEIPTITTFVFNVNKKNLTVKWEGLSYTYDGKEHNPTCTITAGVAEGDEVTLNITDTKATKVGTYSYVISLSGTDEANYDVYYTYKTKNMTISAPTSSQKVAYTTTTLAEGDYAFIVTDSEGVHYAMANNGTTSATIKTADCQSFTDEKFDFISTSIWHIAPVEGEEEKYTISVIDGDTIKYLAATSSKASLKIQEEQFVWDFTNEGSMYYFSNSTVQDSEKYLLYNTNSTSAYGFYSSYSASGYYAVDLYAVVSETQTKSITIKDTYEGGTVTYVSSTGELSGLYSVDTVTLTITPNENKMVSSVTVGSTKYAATKDEDGIYTCVINPKESGEVNIVFEDKKVAHNVTVVSEHGTVSGILSTGYNEGESVTFTVEPATDYVVSKVTVGTEELTTDSEGKYTFTMPNSAATVTVEYKQLFAVTIDSAQADEKGTFTMSKVVNDETVTVASGDKVVDGTVVTIKGNPNDRYELDKVFVNGTEQTGTILTITSESIVKVTFKEMTTKTVSYLDEKNKDEYVMIEGRIKSIENTTYGNVTITDGVKDVIVWGLYQNGVRYDAMDYKPQVGDIINIYGQYVYFKNTTWEISTKPELLAVYTAPTDIAFNGTKVQWNANAGITYDLYNGETLVANEITAKEYDMAASLVEGTTYELKVVAHSAYFTVESEVTSLTYGEKFTFTYKYNDGTTADKVLEDVKATPSELETPTYEGYVFEGWFTDEACTIPATINTPMTANVVVYAKWEKLCTITLDLNYEVENKTTTLDGTYTTIPTTLVDDPVRDGFDFKGWYYDNNVFEEKVNANDKLTDDVTIYAKWTEKLSGIQTKSIDFGSIEGFDKWSSSYTPHTITTEEVEITMTASKQTSTIKDCPVTKGSPVIIECLNGTFNEFTFKCKQWTTKAQSITISYSKDGSSYTEVLTSATIDYTNGNTVDLTGKNAKYVKVTFSSTSNQIGLVGCDIKYTPS